MFPIGIQSYRNLCVSQGSRAQHDFSLAGLEAALIFQWRWTRHDSKLASWHGEGAAGLSCPELSIWEFPSLRGTCRQGWNSIWYCVKGMPQKDTLDDVAYTCLLSYPIVVSHLTFNIFSVCCYSKVSIWVVSHSMVLPRGFLCFTLCFLSLLSDGGTFLLVITALLLFPRALQTYK